MTNPDNFTRNLISGWAAAVLLGAGVCVYVGREIQGLAQAPERLLGVLSLLVLAIVFLHLRESRSQKLAGVQAAGRLMDLMLELRQAHHEWLAALPARSSNEWMQSGQQERILKAVDDLALLTNMTAVNAALEATRAPESLHGFTVVADEVRDLARRSADASRELSDLFGRHQSEATRSAAAAARMAETIDKVKALLEDLPLAGRGSGTAA